MPRTCGAWSLPYLLAMAGLSSCGSGDDPANPLTTVTDSAGVRIVSTSPESLWTNATAWRVDSQPEVVIGAGDSPEQQLFQVASAVVLGDGRIVVGNAGTNELRYYAADGTHLSTVGGTGGGPGEFDRLQWIQRLPGDTIVAFDWGSRRLSFVSPDGALVRSLRIPPGPTAGSPRPRSPVFALGVFASGAFVAGALSFPPINTRGRTTVAQAIAAYGPDAALVDSLGRDVSLEVLVLQLGQRTLLTPAPFGRSAWLAVRGSTLAWGDTRAYEIELRDERGALRTVIRHGAAPVPVADLDVDAERRRVASTPPQGDVDPELLRMLESNDELPVFRPAFGLVDRGANPMSQYPDAGNIVLDAEDHVWVREYAPSAEPPPRWSVFSVTAGYLGTLTLPPRSVLLEVGSDYLLTHWRDEDDVEYVRRHRLARR